MSAAAPATGATKPDPAAGSEPLIRTHRLTKRYDSLTAVDRLDLEVHSGEIFGLLGQNGAGKTTTILMLLGLSEPTSGDARVVGLDPTRHPLEVKRRVGYLPDAVGFYGDLTGRENLRYTARLNGIPRAQAEARIEEVLGQVDLLERADSRTDTYSRGMLQRLGIADALVKDPAILILDEPTTAIDPIGVVEILDLLRRLVRDRGLAVLLSSHLLGQVQSVCDRIGIFAAGRMIGQGTLDDLARTFGEEAAELTVGVEADAAHDPDAVASRLAAVPGVARATRVSTTQEHEWTWHVRVSTGAVESQVRGAILAMLASDGLRLADLSRQPPSLEDIYRRAVARARADREVRAKNRAAARDAARARVAAMGGDPDVVDEASDQAGPEPPVAPRAAGTATPPPGWRPSRVRSRRSLHADRPGTADRPGATAPPPTSAPPPQTPSDRDPGSGS